MFKIVSLGLPLVFTLVLVRGLWNYSEGLPKFYFYFSMALPFLIIIFCGLFKIIEGVAFWVRIRFGGGR